MPDFPVWTFTPFAISALLFGLPHGALDHLVAARIFCRRPPTFLSWMGILSLYLAIALFGWLLWMANPSMGFVAFIALTFYHWGQGELEVAMRWRPDWLGNLGHRASYLAWRGSQPMLLPLVFNGQIYSEVAESCLLLFGDTSPVLVNVILSSPPTAASVCALFWLLEKILAPKLTRWSSGKLTLDALFSALFLFIHPLFGIGIYFLCWHSPHHMNRLRTFLGRSTSLSWSRLMLLAMPFTLLTLVALLLIGTIAASRPLRVIDWLSIYLVALACLTWPHACLVTLQDARERLWQASDNSTAT